MADYQCWPLWNIDAPDNIAPQELPLAEQTIGRLLRWSQTFDDTLNWDDPTSSGFQSKVDAAAFEQEGIKLWLQLRLELGSDYEVYYFSDELHRLVTDPNQLADSVLQR